MQYICLSLLGGAAKADNNDSTIDLTLDAELEELQREEKRLQKRKIQLLDVQTKMYPMVLEVADKLEELQVDMDQFVRLLYEQQRKKKQMSKEHWETLVEDAIANEKKLNIKYNAGIS